jgi:hypothetical protein
VATVEHDPVTGLVAVQTDDTARLFDAHDLAVAGAAVIRLALS